MGIRINKIALELNIQSDQIIEELQKKNIVVKNYMSSIDDDTVSYIREVFSKTDEPEAKTTTPRTKTKKAAKKKTVTKKIKAEGKVATTAKKTTKAKTKTKVKAKVKESKETQAKTVKKKKTTVKAKTKKEAITEEAPKKAKESPETKTIKLVKPSENPPTTGSVKILEKPEPRKAETKGLRVIKKLGLKLVKQEEKPKALKVKTTPSKPVKKPEPIKTKPAAIKAEAPVAPKPKPAEPTAPPKEEIFEKVQLHEGISLRDLAVVLKCSPNEIIRDLMNFGLMATINQTLDIDLASKVADKMGFEVEVVIPEVEQLVEEEEEDLAEDQTHRPPIITIMGHVDHGKTSLLDAIRETNVTESEHGGITQHIGAYQTKVKGHLITFLDTPGHEAFTAMRARGAQVTDIVVLVVAADDGIKPQSLEAIDHAKAANVPIVVAINKIDKHDADPENVKKQLAEQGLIPEDWGGQTIFSEVSALKKTGIENLLEMLLLQAEILEIKANPKLKARGVVIESKLDKGRGPIATIMVQNGTLQVGQPLIMGCYFGRVRALLNDKGKKIMQAGPSTPVEIIGIPEVPQPGDRFMVVKDEKKARQLSTARIRKQRETQLAKSKRITLEDLHQQIKKGEIKELNMIIKGDVQGSIQAVQEAFSKLENAEVRIKVIHEAVGGITESDVLLASASNALIIGFNVRLTEKAAPLATRENVDIRLYSIIYDAIDDMAKALEGMLAPKFQEKIMGRAEVRKIFTIPKMGTIAGCFVLSGSMERNWSARLIRDDVVVHEGKIQSLRRFKDDVKTVPSGYEFGMTFEKYQDLKLGDIVEPFILEELKR